MLTTLYCLEHLSVLKIISQKGFKTFISVKVLVLFDQLLISRFDKCSVGDAEMFQTCFGLTQFVAAVG